MDAYYPLNKEVGGSPGPAFPHLPDIEFGICGWGDGPGGENWHYFPR